MIVGIVFGGRVVYEGSNNWKSELHVQYKSVMKIMNNF